MNIELTGAAKATPSGVAPADAVRPARSEEKEKAAVKVELPNMALKDPSPAAQEERLKAATERINEFIESFGRDLQFTVDKDTKRTVVKVLDRKNGEVVRQIPPDEILDIAKALDTLKGLIIREKA